MEFVGRQKLEVARVFASRCMPYLSSVIMGLIARETADVPTMAVTRGAVMLWNPIYTDAHDVPWIAADILHETGHVVFRHLARANALKADPRRWNYAADACINEMLRNAERAMKGDKFHIGAEGTDAAIFPETLQQPPNLVEETRYRLLTERMQGQPMPMKGENGPGRGSPCGSCAGNPANGEPSDAEAGGRSDADVIRMQLQVAEAIQQAHGKRPGSVPAALVAWAGELVRPPTVDWRTKLTRLVRDAVAYRPGAVDYRWTSPSRRQAGVGYGPGRPLLPALRAPVPRVAVLLDTSGSMYGERTAAAMTEIDGVLRALATDITLVCNDAAVQGIHVVRTIQEAAKRWGGGGGTDLRPAFAALALRRPRPEIVVAVTDGEIGSGYPSVEPPFKTIWTLVGANSEAMTCPWGARVVVPPLEGGK